MLLAVAKDTREYGVDVGKPWRERYDIIPLAEALDREYKTDAHAVGYIVTRDGHALAAQPRLTKPGLDYARQLGFDVTFNTILVDIDNPDHGAWTEDALEASIERLAALPSCAWYTTRGGLHIVQPLATPVPIDVAELYIRSFFYEVQDAGFAVDWSTTDWTRHFRMPFAKRSGKVFAPQLDHANVKPIALAPIAGLEPAKKSAKTPRIAPVRVEWRTSLPDHWRPKIERIAHGMRETDTSDNWHKSFLALTAALLGRGAAPEEVPLVVQQISDAAEDVPQKRDARVSEAKTTVDRWLRGDRVQGYASLPPPVQAAVDDAMLSRPRPAAHDPSTPREPPEKLAERMAEVMREAKDGLTIIRAECGSGKTQAAMRVANERAKDGLKTAIAFPMNALAIEKFVQLRADGHLALRVFGPLSLNDTSGKPVCIHHDIASPLTKGGQSLSWEFCEGRKRNPCSEYLTCRARIGHEGDEDAKIVFGPHALLSALDTKLGRRGLLVIDEQPPTTSDTLVTEDDIAMVYKHKDSFAADYIDVMLPYVTAIAEWTGEGEAPTFDVAHAIDEDKRARSLAPPLTRESMYRLRRLPLLAAELGAASRVLDTLYRASTSTTPVLVAYTDAGAVFTLADARIAKAINREGSVIVIDATPDVATLARLIADQSYVPPVFDFEVTDGARILRTVHLLGGCKRSDMQTNGKPNADAIERALSAVLGWLDALKSTGYPTGQIGIIAPKIVRSLMQNIHGPADVRLPRPANFAELEARLGPYLSDWHGRIVWGHYGGSRGLDTMKHVDALATISDPYPDRASNERAADFAGVDPSERQVEVVRAELQQAHGRMRVVHRERPGAVLHVGKVIPGGSGWRSVDVVYIRTPGGRPRGVPHASIRDVQVAVAKAGSTRKLATEIGVSQSAVAQWLSGKRPVSEQSSKKLSGFMG